MKRFLALLAFAAVAGAMYVTAAPAGPTAAGPTAAQFAALKKQVAKLQKQVKSVTNEADLTTTFVFKCMAHQTVGVSQRGSSTNGYLFGATSAAALPTTALDFTAAGQTPTYTLLTLNPDPQLQCSTGVGLAGHRPAGHLFGH